MATNASVDSMDPSAVQDGISTLYPVS